MFYPQILLRGSCPLAIPWVSIPGPQVVSLGVMAPALPLQRECSEPAPVSAALSRARLWTTGLEVHRGGGQDGGSKGWRDARASGQPAASIFTLPGLPAPLAPISLPSPGRNSFYMGTCQDEPEQLDDWNRIAELQQRNRVCPPHLKTCYPLESRVSSGVTCIGPACTGSPLPLLAFHPSATC